MLRSPADFGLAIRDRRKQLGLGQGDLAEKIGSSRQWVVSVEQGHSRAELGLVLRALAALGLRIDAREIVAAPPTVDLDAIIQAARGRKP